VRNALNADNIAELIYNELQPFAVDMDDFEKEFLKFTASRSDLQRYVLWEIEKAFDPHEGLTISDPKSANIEHIFPQSPSEDWQKDDEDRNRLGNLTLLDSKKNRSIRNLNFRIKCDQAYRDSKFAITRSLTRWQQWDAEAIEARQKEFAAKAKQIWRFA
jgi:hypothetical protein